MTAADDLTIEVSEPRRITRDQIRAAYDALGLDADAWASTMMVQIQPQAVTVIRAVRSAGGAAWDHFEVTS